jgi:hypothetical protein
VSDPFEFGKERRVEAHLSCARISRRFTVTQEEL